MDIRQLPISNSKVDCLVYVWKSNKKTQSAQFKKITVTVGIWRKNWVSSIIFSKFKMNGAVRIKNYFLYKIQNKILRLTINNNKQIYSPFLLIRGSKFPEMNECETGLLYWISNWIYFLN